MYAVCCQFRHTVTALAVVDIEEILYQSEKYSRCVRLQLAEKGAWGSKAAASRFATSVCHS